MHDFILFQNNKSRYTGGGTDYFSMGGNSITTPQSLTVQGTFYAQTELFMKVKMMFQ